MESLIGILALVGSISWLSVLLLPWKPWSTRENWDAPQDMRDVDLSDITVLIPARNEASLIATTMESLNVQGNSLHVILVDDQSDDKTASVARQACTQNLQIVSGEPLPAGWAGKLWALEQGRRRVKTPFTLLMDADIQVVPGTIAGLRQKLFDEKLDFVSLMARLRMESFFERMLMPAFIFFFKLLYPFALGNSPKSRVAVAAGGCTLLRTDILEKIGGFGSLRDALIDDCSLAKKIKVAGGRTWTGLTHSVISHRPYEGLGTVWNMVARSAYTQLRYSFFLLLACTLIMISMFWFPVFALGISDWNVVGILGCFFMVKSYLPTLRYYELSPLWALTLPLIGTLYLAMTWHSAIRYYRGQRSQWKGRSYSSEEYQKLAS